MLIESELSHVGKGNQSVLEQRSKIFSLSVYSWSHGETTQIFDVPVNTWLPVYLALTGYVEVDGLGYADVNVYIDPTITINPDWLDNNPDYQLHVELSSPPPVATPIPGAVWFLGSGLACMIGLKRKRGE